MNRLLLPLVLLVLSLLPAADLPAQNLNSIFTARPDDPAAVYFTPEAFGADPRGKQDSSDALQKALDTAKQKENGCGILFVPQGTYKLSRTIYIPSGVRLIGYGKERPLFVLAKNAPGFQDVTPQTAKGKYLFWFIGGSHRPGGRVGDANAGTFYSSMLNVDIRIEDGNPNAAAIRAHFAQHCSISSVAIHVGKGRAGIVDAGNHLKDVAVYGGDYGIDTDKSAPGWPIMLLDTYFEGQRKSAILTNEGGLTIVRMTVKDAPVAVEVEKDAPERLYMEDCTLDGVSRYGIILSDAANAAGIRFLPI